jgi:hypothetical protein
MKTEIYSDQKATFADQKRTKDFRQFRIIETFNDTLNKIYTIEIKSFWGWKKFKRETFAGFKIVWEFESPEKAKSYIEFLRREFIRKKSQNNSLNNKKKNFTTWRLLI